MPGWHSGDQVHKVKKTAAPLFFNKLLQVLVKDGGNITVTVDGNLAVEWVDADPYGAGFIGLRQVANTVENSYHWFDIYEHKHE